MKKIVVSQRRDVILGREEARDACDVRIGKMLFELGLLPIFLCSEIINFEEYIKELEPDGIFLSGGNDIGEYPQRDHLETYLLDYAVQHGLPVFAVCRGAQMINHYLGGKLKAVKGQVGERVEIVGELAEQYGYHQVNTYHDFAIDNEKLGQDLRVVAQTPDSIVKAIRHKTLPWIGVMWHPEREPSFTAQDSKLIKDAYTLEGVK